MRLPFYCSPPQVPRRFARCRCSPTQVLPDAGYRLSRVCHAVAQQLPSFASSRRGRGRAGESVGEALGGGRDGGSPSMAPWLSRAERGARSRTETRMITSRRSRDGPQSSSSGGSGDVAQASSLSSTPAPSRKRGLLPRGVLSGASSPRSKRQRCDASSLSGPGAWRKRRQLFRGILSGASSPRPNASG